MLKRLLDIAYSVLFLLLLSHVYVIIFILLMNSQEGPVFLVR